MYTKEVILKLKKEPRILYIRQEKSPRTSTTYYTSYQRKSIEYHYVHHENEQTS